MPPPGRAITKLPFFPAPKSYFPHAEELFLVLSALGYRCTQAAIHAEQSSGTLERMLEE
jgi:hypothetical protein